MKKYIVIFCLILTSCATKDKFDPNTYNDQSQQREIVASIITYIFEAPPYTEMKDRFKADHRDFYIKNASRFSLVSYYVSDKGIHYFLLLRPGSRVDERRAVGGHFKLGDGHNLNNFREVFVTPILSTGDATTKGKLLFEKMTLGQEAEYLKMKSYVQWPNEASYYDTTKYEWVLDQSKFK